jgi:membrane-associated phospholipid phosphatase
MATATASNSVKTAAHTVNGEVHRWISVPAGLCLLGVLCFAVDIPVAAYFAAEHLPKFVQEIFDNAETFGHAAGVGLLLIAIAALDPAKRRWIPLCILGAYGGGLLADLIKLFITRLRPRNVDLAATTVWQTFGPLLPLINRTGGDSHSFPSAHTATAFGFATVLAGMYPHGRWLFFSFAVLTGIHRMECSAHFPSDVCFGAAIGWIMGQAALAIGRRMGM